MSLRPPDPTLADDAIRLVPLGARHPAGIEALLEDDGVIRYTRVPSDPPPGYERVWLDRYAEGWRDGTRAGFARGRVLRSYWFKEDLRRDFGIWSRLRGDGDAP